MKDLKCGKKECRFNKGYCCCAEAITVDKHTDCTSYEPVESKRNSLFEAGSDFAPANYSVDTSVSCTANCVFNKDAVCYANGITVMGDHKSEAQCLTFIRG